MSPTLELLGAMLEDIDSPTRGKVGDMPALKSSVLVHAARASATARSLLGDMM